MELEKLDKYVNSLQRQLAFKLDRQDGTRLWRHFQRFAEYEDLKDLYKKCIPQLAKFEQRIMDF